MARKKNTSTKPDPVRTFTVESFTEAGWKSVGDVNARSASEACKAAIAQGYVHADAKLRATPK